MSEDDKNQNIDMRAFACEQTALEVIALVEKKHSDKAEQLTVLASALCALAKIHGWDVGAALTAMKTTWDNTSVGEVKLDS